MFEGKGQSDRGGNAQVKDKPIRYVIMPSVKSAMIVVANYIVAHNGNYAYWHSKNSESARENYRYNINTTIPRIVNGFKKKKK